MDATPYLGLAWQHMGRGPRYDCWGLVRHVMREEFGHELPSYQYGDDPSEAILEGIRDFVQVDSPQAGDLALYFRPLHIGIMVNDAMMLHITHGKDACVERLSAFRCRRVAGFYRLHRPGTPPSL